MIYILIILIAIYNGLIIQWFNNKNKEKEKTYSNLWHINGWLLRCGLILLLPLKFIPLGIFLSWTIYNYIINLILCKPLYNIGSTFIDKYFTKTIQTIIDIILFISSLLIILFT